MEHKYFGGAEVREHRARDTSVSAMIEAALRPMALAVGIGEADLAIAVERDVTRRVARCAFDDLESEGIRLHSSRVLDLGAGLGHASVEAVMRGCDLVAIEPGIEWCKVVRRRLNDAGSGVAIVGDGERLPFADNSFDLIVSIGVLEHVRRPKLYLTEAFRVLRPGGSMFLSCENYLSFWEPHYKLPWLPVFPKPLAAIYLRLRGRSSSFLLSSITYTTRPGVNWRLRAIGFQFKHELNVRAKLSSLLGSKRTFRRLARSIFTLRNLRKTFTPHFTTIVQKPAGP